MAVVGRIDPFKRFRFRVQIDGTQVAGFSEVSGLRMNTDVFPYPEGGQNAFIEQKPGRKTGSPIVLTRGMDDENTMVNWYMSVFKLEGKASPLQVLWRRNLSIVLLDKAGEDVYRWDVYSAFPSELSWDDLSASDSGVFLQRMTLVHHGIEPVGSVTSVLGFNPRTVVQKIRS